MATLTITTPSDKDARIAEAFEQTFPGRIDADGNPTMSKAAWVKQQLIVYIRQVVRNSEANTAAGAARKTVETEVDTFNIS